MEIDTKEGQKAGVTGTPTFFINGKRLVGALPYTEFEKAIEEALK
ncbi:MAG: thioredoxin domain-containing protein [Patescibacteria group bacterium]